MSNIVNAEYINSLQELRTTLSSVNLMLLITEEGFQVVDCNTDDEYNFNSVTKALELIDEYQRHSIERQRIISKS